MNKVVYNNCYGGFSLSQSVLTKMFYLGSQYVTKDSSGKYVYDWDIPRHDRVLVTCVEIMSPDENGDFSELKVKELKGDKYIIHEYDGLENVLEPEDIQWNTVKDSSLNHRIFELESRICELQRQVESLLFVVDTSAYYE